MRRGTHSKMIWNNPRLASGKESEEMAAKWYDWLVKRALATLQLTEKEILELEIREHQNSQKFSMMVKAQEYYQNKTDIRNKKTRCLMETKQ